MLAIALLYLQKVIRKLREPAQGSDRLRLQMNWINLVSLRERAVKRKRDEMGAFTLIGDSGPLFS